MLLRLLEQRLLPAVAFVAMFGAVVSFGAADTIDALNDGAQFAYAENVG